MKSDFWYDAFLSSWIGSFEVLFQYLRLLHQILNAASHFTLFSKKLQKSTRYRWRAQIQDRLEEYRMRIRQGSLFYRERGQLHVKRSCLYLSFKVAKKEIHLPCCMKWSTHEKKYYFDQCRGTHAEKRYCRLYKENTNTRTTDYSKILNSESLKKAGRWRWGGFCLLSKKCKIKSSKH